MYLYDEMQALGVEAKDVYEVVGGQQRLNKDAANAIHALLADKLAVPVSSSNITSEGGEVLTVSPTGEPTFNSDADITKWLYYVTQPAPATASKPFGAGHVLLVNIEEVRQNLSKQPRDITVMLTKENAAWIYSQVGGLFAVLPSWEQVQAAEKKPEKKGIQPAALVGAAIGAAVGAVVGGGVGAVVGAVGTGVLVQMAVT